MRLVLRTLIGLYYDYNELQTNEVLWGTEFGKDLKIMIIYALKEADLVKPSIQAVLDLEPWKEELK